jgi:hypothetical protein
MKIKLKIMNINKEKERGIGIENIELLLEIDDALREREIKIGYKAIMEMALKEKLYRIRKEIHNEDELLLSRTDQ